MADPAPRAPRDVIYEPGERVLAVGRPFASWIGLVVGDLALLVAAAVLAAQRQQAGAVAALVVAGLVFLLLALRYVQWSSRVWVLTDRRVIARAGVLDRTQAAILLERVQDASLSRPFPASLVADYGILHLESAGAHSEERVTEGLHEIAITGASAFYRALTDALTPGR